MSNHVTKRLLGVACVALLLASIALLIAPCFVHGNIAARQRFYAQQEAEAREAAKIIRRELERLARIASDRDAFVAMMRGQMKEKIAATERRIVDLKENCMKIIGCCMGQKPRIKLSILPVNDPGGLIKHELNKELQPLPPYFP